MSEGTRGSILQIANSKGGVAKSTLCENLAAEFARQKMKVCIVDADHKQKTVSKWSDRRNESIDSGKPWPHIPCFIKQGRINKDILSLAEDYHLVIIDTGGRESAEMIAGLCVADVVYVPTQPSQNDVEALEEFVEILERTSPLNPDRRVVGIIVRASNNPNSKEKGTAKKHLEKFKDFLSPSRQTISEASSYRIATQYGGSVVECGNSKTKGEIQVLAREVLRVLTEDDRE